MNSEVRRQNTLVLVRVLVIDPDVYVPFVAIPLFVPFVVKESIPIPIAISIPIYLSLRFRASAGGYSPTSFRVPSSALYPPWFW
jgi:hypothetical protein